MFLCGGVWTSKSGVQTRLGSLNLTVFLVRTWVLCVRSSLSKYAYCLHHVQIILFSVRTSMPNGPSKASHARTILFYVKALVNPRAHVHSHVRTAQGTSNSQELLMLGQHMPMFKHHPTKERVPAIVSGQPREQVTLWSYSCLYSLCLCPDISCCTCFLEAVFNIINFRHKYTTTQSSKTWK